MIVALLLLLLAGFAVASLLLPESDQSFMNLLGVSLLLGPAVISISVFALGYFIAEPYLKWILAAMIAVLSLMTGRRLMALSRLVRFQPDRLGIFLIAVLGLEVALIAAACVVMPLGWDGLLIWESKARLAFIGGGSVPLHYVSDFNIRWTHNEYPLLLPLTEAWLYLWMGRTHQVLVKVVFVLFYGAAIALLAARVGKSQTLNRRLGAAAFAFVLPTLSMPDAGSVASGYADFPIAVYYLGAIVFALRYMEDLDSRFATLASILVACAAWTKQDGLILWIAFGALMLPIAWRARRYRDMALIFFPGFVTIFGWKLFLAVVHCPPHRVFNAVTPANFWAGRERLSPLFQWLISEFMQMDRWSILWPLFALLVVASIWRLDRRGLFTSTAVVVPLLLYILIYVFSRAEHVIRHVEQSMPRLMISPALVALFGITRMWPESKSRSDTT